MKKTQRLFTLLVVMGVVFLGTYTIHAQIQTLQDADGTAITIQATMGDVGRYPPQIAIWTEDAEGKFRDTLYVTYKFATQQWAGNWGQTEDETFRISSVPYWMYKRLAAGLASPTTNEPLPDAVTAASPAKDFTLLTKVRAEMANETDTTTKATGKSEVYVLLEINVAFDENETYPNKTDAATAMYNGQPSLVYRAHVNLGQAGEYEMTLLGHGSWTGEDGELSEDLSTFTTALTLLEKAVVVVE